MKIELLAALNAARSSRRPAVVVTDIATGEQRLALDFRNDPLERELQAALRSGRSGMAPGSDGLFLSVHVPPRRIVAIGAVHISQALAPFAQTLGYAVTIVDPRTAFATPERFSGVDLRAEWPDVALEAIGLDPFTALVALTHDPKIDDPALAAALEAGCFYVGALGSRRTHDARRARLSERGVAPAAIDAIHAPIGLPIGAASPEEIALSILAEITQTVRLPETRAAA